MNKILRHKAQHAKQMGNISREMEILTKNQKGMLEMRNTVRQMKKGSDGISGKLDPEKESLSEFEDILMETTKTEKKRETDT